MRAVSAIPFHVSHAVAAAADVSMGTVLALSASHGRADARSWLPELAASTPLVLSYVHGGAPLAIAGLDVGKPEGILWLALTNAYDRFPVIDTDPLLGLLAATARQCPEGVCLTAHRSSESHARLARCMGFTLKPHNPDRPKAVVYQWRP
ncbi:hypothetical protein [Sphingosinicella microcystinivorans]|uniref:Uncharacterized protein n=1 Tax=Sphingosinicella microcystinivorans TaxID=335406 RepID=A0AAD1D7N3_SPHMI|nr:hypothetical protein [Sphingosinicella microcystinivorans]RKS86504.1 hypothetical protein DFR51_3211 [Sphingosinicella microcystinivorans]BBE35393.1 hypothetical protein SmB9_30510 [Sphingosinicella microcystinivorans]